MPIQEYYVKAALTPGTEHLSLQSDGVAPSIAVMVPNTGWNIGPNALGSISRLNSHYEVGRGEAGEWAASWPKTPPDGVRGDSFRTPLLSGSYAAGQWPIARRLGSVTAGTNSRYRIRIRVWASTNPLGGAESREITTSDILIGPTTANTAIGVSQLISGSWDAPAFTLNNEYLFFQEFIEVTLAGTGNNADSNYYEGPEARITTTNFTPAGSTPVGQNLTPGLLDDGFEPFAPAVVTQSVTMLPGALDASSPPFEPSVAPQPVGLSPGFVDDASEQFAPAVAPQIVGITPGFASDPDEVYEPAGLVAATSVVTISTEYHDFSGELYTPDVFSALQIVSTGHEDFSSPLDALGVSVAPGAAGISVGALDASVPVYDPFGLSTLNGIFPTILDASELPESLSVGVGQVSVAPERVESGEATYSPSLSRLNSPVVNVGVVPMPQDQERFFTPYVYDPAKIRPNRIFYDEGKWTATYKPDDTNSYSDRYLFKSDSAWPPGGGVGGQHEQTVRVSKFARSGGGYRIDVGLIHFPTYEIPADAVIESASLWLYITERRNANDRGLNVESVRWSGMTNEQRWVESVNADAGYSKLSDIPAVGWLELPLNLSTGSAIINNDPSSTQLRLGIGGTRPGSENWIHFEDRQVDPARAAELTVTYRYPAQEFGDVGFSDTESRCFTPEVESRAVSLFPTFVASAERVYRPDFVGDNLLVSLLGSGEVHYQPTLTVTQVGIGGIPFLNASAIPLSRNVLAGRVEVDAGFLSSASRLYAMRLDRSGDEARKIAVADRALLRSVIAGYHGPTQMQTRVMVSNIRGEELGELSGVDSLSFDLSNFRDNTWECSLTMKRDGDFNPLSDWIKIVVEMSVPGEGQPRRFPTGLYRFFGKSSSHFRSLGRWNLTGLSGESIFLEDTMRGVFKVPAGASILKTVRDLLEERGVPREMIDFPMHEDRTLSSDQLFDPFVDDSKGPRIRVINSLLNSGAFYALYTDETGRFTTSRFKSGRAPVVKYGPRGAGGEEIMLDQVDDEWDMENFANAVVVTEEDPKRKVPIKAIAENKSPDSAVSFRSLGYWKVKQVKRKSLADQDSANRIAQAALEASSAFHRNISFTTKPDPERGVKEFYDIFVPREEAGYEDLDGIFRCNNLGGDLHPWPKELSMQVSKKEKVA